MIPAGPRRVSSTLPTSSNRAIGELSMGAHGALQIGFNFPGVFSIIGAHSPTILTRDRSPDYFGDAAYFATVDPFSLARTKDLSGYKIWIDIGQQDTLCQEPKNCIKFCWAGISPIPGMFLPATIAEISGSCIL